MKKVAISQSNYIPWRGYFDIISSVDEFVIFDEVQYTRRDWRNRNKIKTKDGSQWITVPVKVKGKYLQKIRDTQIANNSWQDKHWKTIKNNYLKTPYFFELEKELEKIYYDEKYLYLSKLNRRLIELVCNYLGIKTKIRDAYEFDLKNGQTEKLVNICLDLNADEYISGPSAKNYIKPSIFDNNNIKLTYADYTGYPKYEQQFGGFIDNLSILDLVFNCGKSSYKYMKHLDKNK